MSLVELATDAATVTELAIPHHVACLLLPADDLARAFAARLA